MEKIKTRTSNGAVSTASSAELFAPTNTGGKITLLKYVISADTDGVYLLQDGSGGTTVASHYIAAKGTVTVDLTLGGASGAEFGAPGISLTAGNSLYCDGPASSNTNIVAVCRETGF